MKRKLPKRAPRPRIRNRRPNPKLLAVVDDAINQCNADTVQSVGITGRETKESLRSTLEISRARLESFRAENQRVAESLMRLEHENERLRSEVQQWRSRFDRLLDAMQSR